MAGVLRTEDVVDLAETNSIPRKPKKISVIICSI